VTHEIMADWNPVTVLPNVALEEPIEGELASLVPAHDDRINTLKRLHPPFRSFLHKFNDAFGVKLRPSVLIVRGDAPRSIYDVEAIANFRDLIALSVTLYNRAIELKHPHGHRIVWGNTFSFYPWMLDKDFECMVAWTPAIGSRRDVRKFRGQSSPEIFPLSLSQASIDEPLLQELLQRWRRRYTNRRPAWKDVALYRSLNMAHQASLLPAGSDATFYDIGRSIALWVSAFEILIHPGRNGRADLSKVFDLIERVPWALRPSGLRRFSTGTKGCRSHRTRASWVYWHLYKARCDFLHGNPVSRKALVFMGSKRNVFDYAGPLYRLALTAFLDLSFAGPIPSEQNVAEFGEYMAEQIHFLSYQRTIEEGLLTARQRRRD
jgi:hypothetical protein